MCACVYVVSRHVHVCLCMFGVYVCAHVRVFILCGVRGCIWCVWGVSKYGGGWILLHMMDLSDILSIS